MSISEDNQNLVDINTAQRNSNFNDTASQEKQQTEETIKKKRDFSRFLKIVYIVLYSFAGSLIGAGICMIVASNWDDIPAYVKLISDFIIFSGFISGANWASLHKKNALRELFLVLCFFMTGATIGLIAQIFNLEGGWERFLLAWSLLSVPFVFYSKLRFLRFIWNWMLVISIIFNARHLIDLILNLDEPYVFFIALFFAAQYGLLWLHKKTDYQYPIARYASTICLVISYILVFWGEIVKRGSLDKRGVPFWIYCLFIIFFFMTHIYVSIKNQNIGFFRINIILAEIYTFVAVLMGFGKNLFEDGKFLVFFGLIILAMVYIMQLSFKKAGYLMGDK